MLTTNETDYYNEKFGDYPDFQNEHQAAFALSQLEARSQKVDQNEVIRLCANGFYVVVGYYAQFCPLTDAILPGRANQFIELVTRSSDAVAEFEERFDYSDASIRTYAPNQANY